MILLFLAFSAGTAFAQSSQQKMKEALSEMPSPAALQKFEPRERAVMEECIAILEAGIKIKDPYSAEAKALYERSERNGNALTGAAYQACKKECDDTRTTCLADCGSDFLCRATCRTQHRWCLIACYHSKKTEVPAVEDPVEDQVGGGKK